MNTFFEQYLQILLVIVNYNMSYIFASFGLLYYLVHFDNRVIIYTLVGLLYYITSSEYAY